MENEIKILSDTELQAKVYVIRGVQVMLDVDLAEIYGYSTKAFNQQIKNNIDRFDDDFMFQLTNEDVENLSKGRLTTIDGSRSNFLTLNTGRGRNIKYKPHAFTEQGVYMLMTVLKGDLAVRQSKALIRIFKQMKDFIVENQPAIDQRDYLRLSLQTTQNAHDMIEIRRSLSEIDDKMADVVDKLGECVTKSELSNILLDFSKPVTKIGWLILNGQPIESDIAYQQIYGSAKKTIFIIDNYISLKTLILFKHAAKGVEVTIFSDNQNKGLHDAEFQDFRVQFPEIAISLKTIGGTIHDRYIVIDYGSADEKLYHCGASSKDGGRKVTTITEIDDKQIYNKLVESLLSNTPLVLP